MRLGAIACCVLLLFAGCQGLSPDGQRTPESATTPTATRSTETRTAEQTTPSTTDQPTTESEREIAVEGGTLPFNPDVVWSRVETMHGVDVGKPLTVKLRSFSSSSTDEPPQFRRALGVESPPESVEPAGVTPSVAEGSVVELNTERPDSPGALEGTLAHEYVHVIQMRNWVDRSLRGEIANSPNSPSVDEVFVYRSVMEGSATYVEKRYQRQYVPNTTESIAATYRNSTSTFKSGYATYYFGARYVNATVDAPADVNAVYENPPKTTEELIHRLPPGSEPPAELTVTVDADEETTERQQMGELFVRTTFGTGLNESAAATLADGWGNDQKIRFGPDTDPNFAWVLRWDDPANATEFENGVDAYLDATDVPGAIRVERVAPEIVVLFAGTESFVGEATASGDNSTVMVAA
jgi:hypothetical protein